MSNDQGPVFAPGWPTRSKSKESREETVARWAKERPDLFRLSMGDRVAELDKLTAEEAYMVGAMMGARMLEERGSG